jgi:hypothetical protein
LRNAEAGRTIFANVDLRRVVGLEEVNHADQSTIGLDTFCLSQGEIPDSFLKGSGVPESVIAHLRDLRH